MPASPHLTVCPPLETLDDLELVRSGARRVDAAAPIRIPLPGATPAGTPVEVVDVEGVPLTRVGVGDRVSDVISLAAEPDWTGALSPRPFEDLYLSPAETREVAGPDPEAVVVDRPLRAVDLTDHPAEQPLLLLVLAGPSVDPGATVLATIRSAVQVAEARQHTRVIAVPMSAQRAADEPGLLTEVAAAYTDRPARRLPAAPHHADGGNGGLVVFFTGLSGSGKSTVARAVRDSILEGEGRPVTLLDGDVVRRNLSAGLGFSPADRETNIRRIGWVAAQIAHHGGLSVCSPIAPYDATRKAVRRMVHERGGRFVLVYISTSLAECERRDRKGLYARARAGDIPEFTGISAPYEEPDDADLTLDTELLTVEEARDRVLALLDERVPPGAAGRG